MKQTTEETQKRQTPADSGGVSATNQETAETVWNPRQVNDLVEVAYRKGKTPALLCLGQNEAEALRRYLSAFEDESGDEISLHDYVYAGLRVVQLNAPSVLRVETLESIFEQSRHAVQMRIKMKQEEEQTRHLHRFDDIHDGFRFEV